MNSTPSPEWHSRTAIDPGLSHSLDLLADTYNYNHWIYALCRPWLGDRILEVGAGTGNLTQFMLGAKALVCIEPEAEYQPRLEQIRTTHLNTRLYQAPVQDIPADEINFDAAICVNVLEHIEDDGAALGAMARRIRPGGHVVLYVPATGWAYGAMDKQLGHYRRYNKPMARALAQQCGLRIVHMRYVNFVGLFGWWWSGRVKNEALIDPGKARFMDRLVPYLSAIERIVPIPVGQSLLTIYQVQPS